MSFFAKKTTIQELKIEKKMKRKHQFGAILLHQKVIKVNQFAITVRGVYSLGSDKPKNQTTTNLKAHLRSKHSNQFAIFTKTLDPTSCDVETLFTGPCSAWVPWVPWHPHFLRIC